MLGFAQAIAANIGVASCGMVASHSISKSYAWKIIVTSVLPSVGVSAQ
jgi:hypothetical protein